MTESPPTRNCANCACSYVITPESVSLKTGHAPPATAKPQRVCRLSPPTTVTFERVDVVPGRAGRPSQEIRTPVQGLVQQATTDDTVCWQWRPLGTLPGDNAAAMFHVEHQQAQA